MTSSLSQQLPAVQFPICQFPIRTPGHERQKPIPQANPWKAGTFSHSSTFLPKEKLQIRYFVQIVPICADLGKGFCRWNVTAFLTGVIVLFLTAFLGYCNFLIDFWHFHKYFFSLYNVKLVSLWENRYGGASYSTILTLFWHFGCDINAPLFLRRISKVSY